MTPAKSTPTNVVVVDGSNIATEGRSMPSLTQLNEAVMAFTDEFPDAIVTVVVDATFGHRIDKKELAEFDAAVAHNEVVAPPAGAIGRGDAFVLSIANKVGARILSNDSFQEFHGDYPWLFDEGRLIGGKPVPFVGWVFVERLPVKGPTSRKATRAARGGGRDSRDGRDGRSPRRPASREASLPMPVPTAPPPGVRRGGDRPPPAPVPSVAADASAPARTPAPTGAGPVNDLLPFLDFVEHHPVGSSVNGVVESYSSHGAYVTIGDVRGYVPLRLMGDPPPRSAREMMKLGDAATLVVTSFAPARRSIDLAIPKAVVGTEVAPSPVLEAIAESVVPARKGRQRGAKQAAAPVPERLAAVEEAVAEAALELADAMRPASERERQPDELLAPTKAPAKKAVPRKAPAKKAAAKQAAAKQPTASKRAVAKAPTKRGTAAQEAPPEQAIVPAAAPAEPAAAERAPATPTAAKRTTKKAAARKAPAKKATAIVVAAPEPAASTMLMVAATPVTVDGAPAPRRRASKKAAADTPAAAAADAPAAAPAKRAPRKRSVAVQDGA